MEQHPMGGYIKVEDAEKMLDALLLCKDFFDGCPIGAEDNLAKCAEAVREVVSQYRDVGEPKVTGLHDHMY